MTVEALLKKDIFSSVAVCDTGREITGVYAGDLLSWVMGHASTGECLVTIMSNINVLAVASLLDLPCVILTEDAQTDDEFVKTATEKGINVLKTEKNTYEVCTVLYEALKE